jgi:hypothetical protein
VGERHARAEGDELWTVGPSFLMSVPMKSGNGDAGVGGELSIVRHPGSSEHWESLFCLPMCWGVFAQAESKPSALSSDQSVFRGALGGQASWSVLVGELGVATERRPDTGRTMVGIHTGVAISIGCASIGARLTLLPSRFGDDGGAEGMLVIRATIPLLMPLLYSPSHGTFGPALFSEALGKFPM